MKLIILAAGLSTRYGKLKQLDPIIDNETIMDMSIRDARKAGFDEIVIVVNPKTIEMFKEKYKCTVKYAVQDNKNVGVAYEKPIGTAHALYSAKDYLTDDFVVISADDYYGENAFILSKNFLEKNTKDYGILTYLLKNVLSSSGKVNRGIVYTENGKLSDIKETKGISYINGTLKDNDGNIIDENELASMCFFILRKNILPHLEKYIKDFVDKKLYSTSEVYLPEFIMHLYKEEVADIKLIETQDEWKGVTYPSDKEEVVKYFKMKKNKIKFK